VNYSAKGARSKVASAGTLRGSAAAFSNRLAAKGLSRRHQTIVISQEEEAQVDRLTYVLSNGVKEGLVEGAGLAWRACRSGLS
jgi:hypothetical protein